jgi:hypothetical protein
MAAQQRQETGIQQAVTHSGPTWVEYATEYVRVYLTEHDELFCDDVWAHGLVVPASPRAFGQVMKTAIREGWMVPTDRARKSVRSNNSPRTVYRSTLMQPIGRPSYPTYEP